MRYIKVSGDQFADKMEKIWQDREAKGLWSYVYAHYVSLFLSNFL
jgi:hypothetical protein